MLLIKTNDFMLTNIDLRNILNIVKCFKMLYVIFLCIFEILRLFKM